MWLVLYCMRDHEGTLDKWGAFETLEEARVAYQEALDNEWTYSVSLCAPVESTDYDNPLVN